MIKIKLNGEEKEIEENLSLQNLIDNLNLDIKKIAIEKNLIVIFPHKYEEEMVNGGDQIEIIHFIGGG